MSVPVEIPERKKSSDMSGQQLKSTYRGFVSGVSNRYEVKTSYEEVQMNTFSGKGRYGLVAAFAVLLMPLLGIGNASAIEVNDHVNVRVPDLRQFASAPAEHRFTCRAVTDHAVWLVEDTSFVDGKGGFEDTTFVPKIVWGSNDTLNMVDPADFAALTAAFENDVWGTVTDVCGVPTDINGDGKVVIILASLPTTFNDTSSQTANARRNMYYADTTFNKIEGEAMEVFYLNIHPFTRVVGYMPISTDLRKWNLANGLSNLCLNSVQPAEEEWVKRGIAGVMQYRCFGLTASGAQKYGLCKAMNVFLMTPTLDLAALSGSEYNDYAGSRGQQFLWFMYLAQRQGDSIISTIAKDTVNTGMLSVALAIDPSAKVETAVQDVVVPLYFDWLVCNLHNDFRSDYASGKYKYDFLAGTAMEDWAHVNQGTAFTLSFNTYPISGLTVEVKNGMVAPIWASQYCKFEGYTQPWLTTLNAEYTDGRGANGAINSRWEGLIVKCNDEADNFVSVETISFDSLYNTSFTLTEPNTYIILTNNNPGGALLMRYYISNDTVVPDVEVAVHPNVIATQYLTTYCSLVDPDSLTVEGFDWIGPIFEATLGDSTLNIKMTSFYSTVWQGVFNAWAAGNYELSYSGYDSTGHYVEALRDVAVGFVDTDVSLDIESARLDVPRSGAPAGSMVTLAETGALDFAIQSRMPIQEARGRMTGIVAGPVAITDVNGTLSFASSSNETAVYRYTANGWVMLNSWLQGGYVSTAVEEGGVYALGEGIGVFSPEIPAQLVLNGNAPNPFAAQTAISFGLPVSGNVTLNVYDMSGRLVTNIANEEMAAANHTIVWDGTDSTGSQVGAGVYFCRLETAGQVLTQKMLKVQ